jgi:ComF family protein
MPNTTPTPTPTKADENAVAPRSSSAFRQWLQRHLGACSPYLAMQCLLCEQAIVTISADHLCPHCRLALPFNRNPCLHCALPLQVLDEAREERDTSICPECLTKPLANRAIAPLVHRHEAAHLIHRLKFHRSESEGRTLAMLMATQVRLREMGSLPTLLVPVPVAYATAVHRGFNQSALLAWHLARTFNIGYAPKLLARQGGPAQRSLSRGQRLNSAQFARRSSAKPLAGAHVAIVDDVLTTGTTVRRVSRLLRQLGAGLIDVWCATRTPSLNDDYPTASTQRFDL